MKIKPYFVCGAIFVVTVCLADISAEDLEKEHKASITTTEGKAYEAIATQDFWGDAGFMRECVPPDSALPEPLVIYYEVLPNGSLGDLTIIPTTAVSQCISEAIASRKFPYPPHRWVGKIKLGFSS